MCKISASSPKRPTKMQKIHISGLCMMTPTFLAPSELTGGHMFPDHARLFMAGIEDAEYKEEKQQGGNSDLFGMVK